MKFLLLFILKLPIFCIAKHCAPSDFIYEYTKCDQNGERWRIAVPKSHRLQCDNVPAPSVGLNCSFSCNAGQYVDLETQVCRQCPPGTYSLGNGVRYEDFTTLPSVFSIENFEDDVDQVLGQMNDNSNPFAGCSKESGWVLQNSELRYVPTTCISKLSISVHLIQKGYVEFFYKMPKNSRGLISNLDVRNEQCESYANHLGPLIRPVDEEINTASDWKIKRITLKSGQNLITWTVANNRELTTLADVIYVPKIDIVGLAFSSECTRCPEGTFSGSGKKQCSSCGEGFYSLKGSSVCKKCAEHEYSGPRASKCITRPPCTSSDFYGESQKCAQNRSNLIYKTVEPNVCREDIELSARKPQNSFGRACPKCSPGMQRGADGNCQFCQQGEFSLGDGNKFIKTYNHEKFSNVKNVHQKPTLTMDSTTPDGIPYHQTWK
uniref:Tyrosine-protein kinase ephrin type A/B receptor-like domain-containing protein n=1 Tax=Acrobeloides nanus TaxID=290746 RepID=A0A914CE22_9BILA